MPRQRATVRMVGALGAVLFWALLLPLWLGAGLPAEDAILLAVLLVVVPTFSLAQLPLIEDSWVERLPAYWGSIAMLWLIGAACSLVGTRQLGPAGVGFIRLDPVPLFAWSVGLVGAGLLTILVFREVARRTGAEESPILRQLLPRSGGEKRVFALLSLAAGFSEELAYRGYAISMLSPFMGAVGAAAFTSAVFGVLHGYQGFLGALRTSVLGGLLAWGFLASGSLWPAIIAHTVIDLLSGVVLGERLLPPVPQSGVSNGRWKST